MQAEALRQVIDQRRRELEETRTRLAELGIQKEQKASPRLNLDVDALVREALASVAPVQVSSKLDQKVRELEVAKTVQKEPTRKRLLAGSTAWGRVSESMSIIPRSVTTMDRTVQAEAPTPVAPDDGFGQAKAVVREKSLPVVPEPVAAAVEEIAELTEDERQQHLSSIAFGEFFDEAATLITKVLHAGDPVRVYGSETGDLNAAVDLTVGTQYVDDAWSKGRPVSHVVAHPSYPEYFLASYVERDIASPYDSDGVVLMWNMAMNAKPEYVFTAQAPVTCCAVNPYNPHLIFGGTTAGQILLWDTRTGSTPTQRTALSMQGHQTDICGIEFSGAASAYNLVSVDSDSRMSVWALGMLTSPTECIDIVRPNKSQKEKLTCTCMTLPGAFNAFLGTSDGMILEASTSSNKHGYSEAIHADGFEHHAPVMSLHSQIVSPDVQSELLLSTSMDWSIKVWNPRSAEKTPLAVIEAYNDFIFNAVWSPTHSSVFTASDCAGHLDVWDLARSADRPALRASNLECSMSTLAWTRSGRQVLGGGINGVVNSFSVPVEYQYNRGNDSWLEQFEGTAVVLRSESSM